MPRRTLGKVPEASLVQKVLLQQALIGIARTRSPQKCLSSLCRLRLQPLSVVFSLRVITVELVLAEV